LLIVEGIRWQDLKNRLTNEGYKQIPQKPNDMASLLAQGSES
jgi:hypothetical protein